LGSSNFYKSARGKIKKTGASDQHTRERDGNAEERKAAAGNRQQGEKVLLRERERGRERKKLTSSHQQQHKHKQQQQSRAEQSSNMARAHLFFLVLML
jgi:hypothetical protein